MKIIVDSGCDLNAEVMKELDAGLASCTLTIGDRQFVDDRNIDVAAYAYEMENSKHIAKTAAPAPELYLSEMKNSTGSVFAVTLSSHLSSSYNNAMLAKQTYLSEVGERFIHIFDSFSASAGEAVVALKINEFIKENISESEIVEKVNEFIKNVRTYLVLEKYTNLIKNGRINPYIGKLASLLNIKPICKGVNGKIELAEKIRGTNKAIQRLIEIIVTDKIDFENRVLAIAHSNCIEKALYLKEEVMKRVNFKDCIISPTRGTCTTYADREGIVVAY